MNTNKIITLLIIILVGAGVYFFINKDKQEPMESENVSFDPLNASYTIEGESVTLVDGIAFDSVSKMTTRYFGNEVKHDLNDDGREDVAFLITQEGGGTGLFFSIVAALNTPSGALGSHSFPLGDRIAPQTTEIDEGETTNGTRRQNVIVVNYADRAPNEPYSTPPSIGKSIWLKLDPSTMQFGEVAQNFEGESR